MLTEKENVHQKCFQGGLCATSILLLAHSFVHITFLFTSCNDLDLGLVFFFLIFECFKGAEATCVKIVRWKNTLD